MNIGATGIVIDHYGDVLLIQRNDTRTLAPPGGSSEIGELPTETVEREVKEETGLIVMPVRLVGLYYFPTTKQNYLSFCFRCIMRGGQIKKTEEALQAGFFKANPLPGPMLEFHKKRVSQSLTHQDGAPLLVTQEFPWRLRLGKWVLDHIIYPWLDLRRRQQGIERYQEPPQWRVTNYLIIKNNEGKILWAKAKNSNEWNLPYIESQPNQAPWETAAQMVKNPREIGFHLSRLTGIDTAENSPEMALIYSALIDSGIPVLENSNQVEFVSVGDEFPFTSPQHISWIKNSLKNEGDVHYSRPHLS